MVEGKVQYVQLGKSGLRVSNPILGAMSFGDKERIPWCLEADEALPLLKDAYELGITSWDTANVYSAGESERIIAKAIKQYGLDRSKIQILTKCYHPVLETVGEDMAEVLKRNNKNYINHCGLSRAAIFNQVEASLERLETSYIDLLQCHRRDKTTPLEETMEALNDLVRSGKVRYLGMSSCFAWELAEMQHIAERRGWTKFVSMQNHYSLLYREEEREVIPYAKASGVGLIPWGPLAAGALARPYAALKDTSRGSSKTSAIGNGRDFNIEAEKNIIGRVEELAKKKDWTMSQVAIAWIMAKGITAPIIGFSSRKRMEEAIEANGKTLTEAEIKHLEEPYMPHAISGHQ